MKHPVDSHVGKKVRHRRWMVGMTQQKLADCVGIKFQQIQKYETGMNRINASRLWDIAEALDVPVSYFFDGLSTKNQTPPLDAPMQGDLMSDMRRWSSCAPITPFPRTSAGVCSILPGF